MLDDPDMAMNTVECVRVRELPWRSGGGSDGRRVSRGVARRFKTFDGSLNVGKRVVRIDWARGGNLQWGGGQGCDCSVDRESVGGLGRDRGKALGDVDVGKPGRSDGLEADRYIEDIFARRPRVAVA